MPERKLWAIDSSVVLGALKDDKGTCAELLRVIDSDRTIQVVASTLLLAECAYAAKSNQAELDAWLASPRIAWVSLTTSIATEARALVRYDRFSGSDAVHVASALQARCSVLFSDDNKWPYGPFRTLSLRRPEEHGENRSLLDEGHRTED